MTQKLDYSREDAMEILNSLMKKREVNMKNI